MKSAEEKNFAHAAQKNDLRKGITMNLIDSTASWKCKMCGHILLSKAGYINHLKSQDRPTHSLLSPRPGNSACVICREACESTSGLKRHVAVHKDDLPQ